MSENHLPLRVLLINDNREVSAPLATLLLVVGYEVEMAFDGPSAIEAAESFRPDICLVDVNVPRLNVYDLSGCLRERLDKPPFLGNITPFHDRDDWDVDAEFDLDFTKPSDPVLVVEQMSDFLRLDKAKNEQDTSQCHKTHGKPRMPSFRRT
jgi:DNA-binding response OmpR family regulator